MANRRHLRILGQGVETWNKWRADHKSTTPDLSNLRLTDTDLGGADFSGVDFVGSVFQGTSLRKANLRSANLSEADLRFADLTGADLTGAVIVFANLTGTTLRQAQFAEALVDNATFADNDLSKARGLETAIHNDTSYIDINTLYRSRGRIPESFLRGAGVPKEIIKMARSIRSRQHTPFYSCFISYSHDDKSFADLLHERLRKRDIRCWLDEHQLLPGDDLHESIDRGIRLWDKVLLCASKASLNSWWVDGEINRAFQKEAQLMKERGKKVLALIPLNLDGFLFRPDYQSGKKAEITSRVAANFVGWEKDHSLFDRELEKVIRALRTDDGGREKPPPGRL